MPGVPVISSTPISAVSFFDTFVYQVLASGNPRSFSATGLPGGVNIDAVTGLVSGIPMAVGTYGITVSATNTAGTGTQSFTLTVNPAAGSTFQQDAPSNAARFTEMAVRVKLINDAGQSVGASAGQPGAPLPVQIQPTVATQSNDSGPTVGTSSGVILAANAGRLNATFVNFGSAGCFLTLGATAVSGRGIFLAPNGGSYNIDTTNLYRGAVAAITATGTTTVSVHEGY